MSAAALHSRHTAAAPAGQMVSLLGHLATVVAQLDDSHYRAERAREVSGSVGGHVRHCLDHVAALVRGLENGHVDYDARVRGTAIEYRREAALAEIARLIECLQGVARCSPDTPVRVDVGSPDFAPSTLARELAFISSHTIHHFALIALLLHDMGIRVPPRFGYAPSTPSPELAA
jgi:uncharacterized damage-inducible protein DinB